jgi:hypothetical protein
MDAGPPDAAVDAGSLYLAELDVSGYASGSSVTLIPRFSPAVYDYYVRCAEGSNALSVSLKASPGASSLLEEPTASTPAPEQTQAVSVRVNRAIVAAATDGTRTVEYWVRCLPPDFPAILWSPHPEAGERPPGYYLLGTSLLPRGSASYAFILDGQGVPVWYLRASGTAWGDGTMDVDRLVDGAVSFFRRVQPAPQKFEILHFSPYGATYAYSGDQTDEHEIQHLPNGNFVTFSRPMQSGVDLTGVKLGLPDGGLETLSGLQTINGCVIEESTPDHVTVWTWDALHHFDPRKDATFVEIEGMAPGGGPSYSVFHCNSIDVDPANGNLLVSSRHMDSVFYIERATGTVLWKMGGDPYTKEGAPYIAVPSPFHRQHDARLQPTWSETCAGGRGQVSLFDDETDAGPKARGVVYDVTVGPPDGGASRDCGAAGDGGKAKDLATVAWEYPGARISNETGSFRISSDGSRVICWGGNEDSRTFTEVDVAKHDLLDVSFDRPGESYRVIKVPIDAYDLGVLRRTAGRP